MQKLFFFRFMFKNFSFPIMEKIFFLSSSEIFSSCASPFNHWNLCQFNVPQFPYRADCLFNFCPFQTDERTPEQESLMWKRIASLDRFFVLLKAGNSKGNFKEKDDSVNRLLWDGNFNIFRHSFWFNFWNWICVLAWNWVFPNASRQSHSLLSIHFSHQQITTEWKVVRRTMFTSF